MRITVRIANPLSIKVESPSNLGGATESGVTEMEISGETLLDLLLALNEKYSSIIGRFVDPETKRVVNHDVFINRNYYECAATGVHVVLKEGDEVDVHLPMIGGG
jgi:molybdopterin converting factor small subunit